MTLLLPGQLGRPGQPGQSGQFDTALGEAGALRAARAARAARVDWPCSRDSRGSLGSWCLFSGSHGSRGSWGSRGLFSGSHGSRGSRGSRGRLPYSRGSRGSQPWQIGLALTWGLGLLNLPVGTASGLAAPSSGQQNMLQFFQASTVPYSTKPAGYVLQAHSSINIDPFVPAELPRAAPSELAVDKFLKTISANLRSLLNC